MPLSEQQYIILFSLVKFYARPQEKALRLRYGDDVYNETYNYFKENLEYFVNQKIALDRIYDSLCNASQAFALFRQMEANGKMGSFDDKNERRIFRAFNESFISSLIINFSKLKEVLTFRKNIIFKDVLLSKDFAYLDNLNNRINKAKVTELRNGWFAHAYQDQRKGIVYRDKDIKEMIFNILENLCLEEHLDEFNRSTDRLGFFCETYLFEGRSTYNIQSIISDVVHNTTNSSAHISTRPKEIIREINVFAQKIREKKLLGIESFFIVEDSELEKWGSSPEEYFKKELNDLRTTLL